MSGLPRFANVSVPDSDGVMHTVDWMRADIAGELLEALESCLSALIRETAAGSHLSAEIAQARAAIAKAKGE